MRSPAYAGSFVEVRAEGEGIEGAIYYDRLRVVSDRAEEEDPELELRVRRGGFGGGRSRGGRGRGRARPRKTRINPGAFKFALADKSREIGLLAGREYGKPLASRLAGSLELDDGPDALRFRAERLPGTTYANDLREAIRSRAAMPGAEPLYRLPPPEALGGRAVSTLVEEAPGIYIEEVREAVLTGIAVTLRVARADGDPIGT